MERGTPPAVLNLMRRNHATPNKQGEEVVKKEFKNQAGAAVLSLLVSTAFIVGMAKSMVVTEKNVAAVYVSIHGGK